MSNSKSKNQLLPSLATPSKLEYAEMDRALTKERVWYVDTPRMQTNEQIKRAIRTGKLVKMNESNDLKPIARFNASVEGFTPYLTPRALRAARAFGSLWRVVLEKQFKIEDRALRLAVTSMTRSQEYQDTLVAQGRFASPDSTHCTGNAFDIDVSGYYSYVSKDQVISHVDPRRRAASQHIGKIISKKINNDSYRVSYADAYDERITEAALWTAELLYDEEVINRIHEFKDTPNACLHIAVNPDF